MTGDLASSSSCARRGPAILVCSASRGCSERCGRKQLPRRTMTLFDAIREGNEGRVCSLTRADPTLLEKAEEDGGDVPLVVAVEHEKVGMVRLLLKEGAQVNGKGHKGETALIRAIKKGNEALVAWLLDNGAKTDLADAAGSTPLIWASMMGKLGVVKLVFAAMVRAGLECGLNSQGAEEKTALHHAAEGGHFDVVAYLLCKEAWVDIKDMERRTPLMLACEKAPLEVVQILLVVAGGKGQGLETTDDRWETALHCAARGGNKETVAFLLRKGLQAGSPDGEGRTPLMLACWNGHLEVAQILSDATEGQGLEERDVNGETVLSFAATGGNIEVVAYLLSKGAQTSSRDEDGYTPFMWACKVGEVEAAQLLFDATQGQGLEDQDEGGGTALYQAATGGHKEVVAFLLSKGADISSRDVYGRTPLLCACYAGDLELVQMVLTATEGQGLEDRDHRGWTVLHKAAIRGSKELVVFLLSKGVQADIKNDQQETALMRACYSGNQEVAQLLLKYTGDQGVNDTNSEGRTALHLAMAFQWRANSELVRALLLAGANPDTADNEGRTPWQLAGQLGGHSAWVEAFEWWDGELERPFVLYRARCLHDVSKRQHTAPAAPVPDYLAARVAAGAALPRVHVMAEAECTTKRKRADDGERKEEQEEGEAVRGFVVGGLNEELFRELMEGFHGFGHNVYRQV